MFLAVEINESMVHLTGGTSQGIKLHTSDTRSDPSPMKALTTVVTTTSHRAVERCIRHEFKEEVVLVF